MQKLIKAIKRHCRQMESGDIISCLKVVVLLGMHGSDPTLQTLLKMLTKQANTIDLSQIFYLSFLLSKMRDDSKSALSTALEYALPVVFESRLEKEVSQESLQSLCDYLHYATKNSLADRSIKVLVEGILRQIDKISSRQAMSVLWSLADCKHDGAYQEPLITVCFKHMIESLETLSLEELNTTMSKSAKKYLRKLNYFYNEDFVQAYCNRLMTRYVDPSHALWSCKYVSIFVSWSYSESSNLIFFYNI
jgi:hypothetical protein